MRKLLALAAALGVISALATTAPADAADPLDNVVANVNGGVDLDIDDDGRADADGDFDGDTACDTGNANPTGDNDDPDIPADSITNGTCDDDPGTGPTGEQCTTTGGAPGDKAQFTDVVITGVFSAFNEGTSTAAAFAGAIEIGNVEVCVADAITTHDANADNDPDNDGNGNGTNDLFDPDGDGNGDVPPVPLTAAGSLSQAIFNTLGSGTDLVSGDAVCLFGELVAGGTFVNTGAVTSVAHILTNYDVREVDGAGADPCDTETGALIASSDGNVELEANVVVAPAGLLTGGSLPDVVSAQVHSIPNHV